MKAPYKRNIAFAILFVSLVACTFNSASNKPTIIIQSPPNGSQFREGEQVTVQSVATDSSGIVNIDLIIDGVTARTDKTPVGQTKLVSLTQSWKAIAGTHTIGVRAFNTSGITSDMVSVTITVSSVIAIVATPVPTIPSLTATRLPPTSAPATATTMPSATPFPTPTITRINLKFDAGVNAEQREAVQKGIALAQQYFGDVGTFSVSAYANLDTLMDESNRYYKRTADSEASKNVKQHLQNGAWVAYAEGDAMWLWISKFKMWQPSYIQYAWQLVAHEYFHVMQNYTSKKTGDAQAPLWLREGSAEYGSYVVVANAGLVDLKRLTKAKIERTRGILNPLSMMETLKGAEAEDTETPYTLGFIAAQFIAANYGEPALVKKYWQVRATATTWQEAFKSTFDISVDEFYRKFEDYRRAELPPYCGTVDEPASSTLTVKFDRQFLPGTLNFQDFIYSPWSPEATGYTFCVKGYPLATTSWEQVTQILKYPKDIAKLDSCGGSCWILYMLPNAPVGTYTFTVELPDGRRAESRFQHGTAITPSVVAPPTPIPPTRVPATATPALPPGIYVSAVQLDPPEPKNGQYPTFKVTFINTLGQTVYYKWFVKIYDPDAKQSMGETAKVDATLSPGTSIQISAANWKAIGTTPCRQFIARVFFVAPDGTILEFPKPGGENLWHYFSVCQ